MSDRRQSVAPSISYRYRSRSMAVEETESSLPTEAKMFSNALRTASIATSHLRRVTKMFSIDKTKEVIRGALEDSDRVEYVRLACELEELTKESKQLKGFILELYERYDAARSLDPIRRYRRMQSMAKTIVLQLRVNDPTASVVNNMANGICDAYGSVNGSLIIGDVLQSTVKQKEMRLKHENIAKSLSTEQLQTDISRFNSEIRELQYRIDAITEAINNIDIMYNSMKREPFVKRYANLKEVIKEVLKFADVNAENV